MRRQIAGVALIFLLMGVVSGADTSKPRTSFTDRMLEFFGVADTPTLKGSQDAVAGGELWLADLRTKRTHAISTGTGDRSPVFFPGTADVLALRGSFVVKISAAGGVDQRLYSVDSIVKLVSFAKDPQKVLILLQAEAGGHPRVALLTLGTGSVTAVPYDVNSSRDLQMVESLQGWSRSYGEQNVYVKRVSKQAMSGLVEWTDVFSQIGDAEPINVSQCDGTNCGEPALSQDRTLVVYVKAVER